MSRERELLERAVEALDGGLLYRLRLHEEIRAYLMSSKPENIDTSEERVRESGMKTLTPKQREEGFIKLEAEIGEIFGGAHLMSFLAGVAHAEKVLGEPSEAEPVAFHKAASEEDMKVYRAIADNYHPAPRKEFVRLSEEQIQEIHSDMYDATTGQWADMDCFARAIEDALEEKNK